MVRDISSDQNVTLFCLLVASASLASLAELHKLKACLDGLFVLCRVVVDLAALGALELDEVVL